MFIKLQSGHLNRGNHGVVLIITGHSINIIGVYIGIGIAVPMVITIMLCGTTIFLLHKQYESNRDPR